MSEDRYGYDESDDGSRGEPGGRGQRRGGRGGGRSQGRGKVGYGRRRKHCSFCAEKVSGIDYKTPDVLRYFLTEQGKIRARRQTGVCAKHQRQLSIAIKRARHLALLPFVADVAPRR